MAVAKKTRKTSTKKTTAKSGAAAASKIAGFGVLDDGQRPKDKFAFLYILFACTTLIFAGLSIWLFQFSSDILNKYEEIDVCARTNGASCEVRVKDTADGEDLSIDAAALNEGEE